ncbi:hypothetical protein DICPUDRAFT_91714 [Dictyostelium purpureum]|uniref:GH84 domain-containing protein n=1 Tax=Dictyostelium purpureum TaxID=5786 RepID=F0ZGB1_DICPU|nr:uncharacterized protein DICPUDRAFT_91714 [Dictyostelium purpureum]EGC37012.1 hypothetical protein DICPUDRAFT_91714 [Dictyostelium purpureum]|eukprot:XP_003286440.1 hypothetical protein DICPUDRAFT_91714 [Dictyostelium purpureum]
MKIILKLFFTFLLMIKFASAVINPNVGVVEGFYWTQDDTINGQYGEYSFTQRKQLIQTIAAYNLGVYWYVPQTINTMALWSATQLSEWTTVASLGQSLGVKVVVGIRPGWLETAAFPTILARLQQIHSTGVAYYTLNFDDAEGVATTAQQNLEVQLVSYLQTNLPSTFSLYGMIPYAYYQDMFSSKTIWQTKLAPIDAVSSAIPFIFTGKVITPSTFSSSQFPTLSSSRNMKFFDNWIASDANRISWGMIDGRVNANIFTSSYGYILNLAFPLERVIHHLYCAGQLASGGSSCSISTASQEWANWLNTNGFLHGKSVSTVKSSLQAAINADTYFETMADFEAAYPNLAGIFTTLPTI